MRIGVVGLEPRRKRTGRLFALLAAWLLRLARRDEQQRQSKREDERRDANVQGHSTVPRGQAAFAWWGKHGFGVRARPLFGISMVPPQSSWCVFIRKTYPSVSVVRGVLPLDMMLSEA